MPVLLTFLRILWVGVAFLLNFAVDMNVSTNHQPAPRPSLKLGKEERLRHKSLVDGLFTAGSNIYDFPLRLTWRALTPEELESAFRAGVPPLTGRLQMLITVPKKKRRRAVDRVLMRRRIREAYRLNRGALADVIAEDPTLGSVSLAFVYLAPENLDYRVIEEKMIRLLSKLRQKLLTRTK